MGWAERGKYLCSISTTVSGTGVFSSLQKLGLHSAGQVYRGSFPRHLALWPHRVCGSQMYVGYLLPGVQVLRVVGREGMVIVQDFFVL